ncbi:uncharacterized protein LOC127002931 [Eriocheir sinensis]|uniref:uncharacterized protein LOC127002931 n=1 Tax=Eriocheir sinensis TaxID=95602 RepID=UPI0021C9C920|nr:uncharacterized protein LOC127002931 [Eriocheir sinensis]
MCVSEFFFLRSLPSFLSSFVRSFVRSLVPSFFLFVLSFYICKLVSFSFFFFLSFLPFFLPSFLPSFLHFFLPPSFPSFLPSFFPSKLSSFFPSVLPSFLPSFQEEKDLGVTISSDLKHANHCKKAYNKANTMLGFIARNFECKTPDVMLSLYNSMVRPHLEYAVQFWTPYYRKDIALLERIQRRATKMIPTFRAQPYEERLKRLNLFTLEKRRLRGDMIQVFKYLKKFNNVDYSKFFELQTNLRTRNNGLPIQSSRCNTDIGRSFFSNRVIRHWNNLPSEVINANTINSFKYRIDRHFAASGVN